MGTRNLKNKIINNNTNIDLETINVDRNKMLIWIKKC